MENSVDLPPLNTTAIPLIGSIHAKTRSYLAFIWLGLGTLLPFNFFITAAPYFCYKLKDSNQTNSSVHFDLLYESTVILCSSLTNLITTILITVKLVPYIYKYRIYSSLSIITICFFISLALALIKTAEYHSAFFFVTMILVMIQSICSAILLNCFYSLASTLPSRYIQGFGTGQALGGIFIAVCSIISLVSSTNPRKTIASYFLCAMFVIITNIIVYYFLEKSQLFHIYSSATQEINNEYEPLFRETSSTDDDDYTVSTVPIPIRQRLFIIYKQIKWNYWGIFLTFVITFSIFPASLSKIKSNTQLFNQLFVPIMTFLLFFICETFGRLITSKLHVPSLKSPRSLFFICLSRFIFPILFAFCNFPNTENYLLLFKHDAIYGILIFFFAVSHGYCNSLNFMYAPRRVQTQFSSTVGALMMMAVASGTFIGSLVSYGVFILYGLTKLSSNELCP